MRLNLLLSVVLFATFVLGCSAQAPTAEPSVPAASPTAAAPAADEASPEESPGGHKRQAGIQRILEKLDLTPEQREKVDAIQRAHAGDPDRKAMFKEIHAVLTPEQQEKMKELRSHRHRHATGTPSDAPTGASDE